MSIDDELKKKILNEMTVKYANTLEKNFEIAKKFIRITNTGKVDILNKENLKGQDKILLYLIGKRYAKEAGLSSSVNASNNELIEELGIKMNSLLPWLKFLRDAGKIEGNKGEQAIKSNLIEETLKRIDNGT